MIPHCTMEDFLSDSDEITVEVLCLACKKPKRFVVPKSGYDAWVKGALIQRALPQVPEGEREMFISQTCGPCFDKLLEKEES